MRKVTWNSFMRRVNTLEASKEFMKYLHPSVPSALCDTKHGQQKSPFSHDIGQASWEAKKKK
jgi:hypothetical protein